MLGDQDHLVAHQPEAKKMPKLQIPKGVPKAHQQNWSPYEDNGGTVAAVAGKGYVIVAGDTRLNGDFCVLTRLDGSKLCKLTGQTILASTGMQADRLQLQQVLKYKCKWYQYNNGGSTPSTAAIAQLLSTILYHRRFFPYYTFNVLAGLDENGNGVCYSYDAVGCTEPLSYGTTGSANQFMEPLLDCLILRENMVGQAPSNMTKDDALLLLKNAFTGAGERDIFTGDGVKFLILTPEGLTEEYMPLRAD
jgi:20S proteasome subunit beta 6